MREPRSLLDVAPVLPLIKVRTEADVAAVVPVARALTAAGLPMVQIALAGPASHPALEAIERLVAEAPEVVVGAGALNDPAQPGLARAAGAEFLVATGAAEGHGQALHEAMRASELPHLPQAGTVVEALGLVAEGYTDMVLHPADALGGLRHLRALGAFVPPARFCVSGNVTAADLTRYCGAPNVGCVIADWLAPADAVARRDWDRIRRLAEVARALSTPTVTAVRAL